MKGILWAIFILGILATCNDTREQTWLAFPGILAGAVLVGIYQPKGETK